MGYIVNHKRVQKIMQEMELFAIYPKPKLSISNNQHKKYPYLLRDIKIDQVNQVWATDITYIRLSEGFVYLMAIMDLYSRYILDFEISTTMEAEFCVSTLARALQKYDKPQIFNTDQGSQFTCNDWIDILASNGVKISMDGKGRCFDNILVERLWRTIKYEEVYIKSYDSVQQAKQMLAEFVHYYNEQRPHQSLAYATPGMVYNAAAGV